MSSKGALHEDLGRAGTRVQGSTDRSFGLVFAVVFTIVALWPLLDGRGPRWWALAVAMAFGLLAAVRPGLLAPLNRLWTGFGLLLHRVTTPIIMGVLFFLVITPFGLARRLVRRDPLGLRRDTALPSYWIRREPPGPAPRTLERQF